VYGTPLGGTEVTKHRPRSCERIGVIHHYVTLKTVLVFVRHL